MGDPAGIGPEITVRALNRKETYEKCRPIVTGDAAIMEQAVSLLGFDLKVNAVQSVKDAKFEYGTIDVLDLRASTSPPSSSARCRHSAAMPPSSISRKPSNWPWPTRWTAP